MKKAEVKSLFKQAQAKKGELGNFEKVHLPVGQYRGSLKTKFFQKTPADAPMIIHNWTILDGEFKGKQVTDFKRIDNVTGIAFTQKMWEELGFEDTASIDSYEEMADMAMFIEKKNPVAVIQIKHANAVDKEGKPYMQFSVSELEGYLGDDSDEESPVPNKEGEEPEDDDGEDDDEGSIEVGSVIKFNKNGKVLTKSVIAVNEDEGTVVVKVAKEMVEIPVDDIVEVVED